MDNSIYLLASAMELSTLEQSKIANNLANVKTPGFKEVLTKVESDSIFETDFPRAKFKHNFKQGILKHTGNNLDVALEGDGFIALENNCYLRSGTLKIDKEGYITDSNGNKLLDNIQISSENIKKINSLKINSKGALTIDNQEIGKFKIIKNNSNLISKNGTYIASEKERESELEEIDCKVYQGYLENSTVDPMYSMTEMIENTRYFESISRIMNVIDKSWQELINHNG